MKFDHIAVACDTLGEGVAAVEAALGVVMGPGGQHPYFGTHNRLLSLGGMEYLEVIAIDPSATAPERRRWFGLDGFSGRPRPTNWILSCRDLDAAIARVGPGVGKPVPLSRGDYRWRMAVPDTGLLPFDNLHPALIEWQSTHPAPSLPESGCRLKELVVTHPDSGRLQARLALAAPRIRFETGTPSLAARISTPTGDRILS